ncbi:MAG: S-layer homology domain-containing protein [Clostridia bacterium]|nr:S-layer homology domain-containing protein [Clostridia bacterium]
MKKSIVGILVFALLCTASLVVFAANFSDVNSHWAQSSISRWSNESIVNGYTDGTFKPESNITRAEFAAIVTRLFEPTRTTSLNKYTDIESGAWYYDSVAKAVAMGALDGSTSKIRPNDYITREEAMNGLNSIYALTAKSKSEALAKFSDSASISSWAESAVAAFTEYGYVNGYPDGTVKPSDNITRAEFAKMLDRAVALIIKEDGEYDLTDVNTSVIVKSKNVSLNNVSNVDRVFVLNDDMNDSLKIDGKKASNTIIISATEKESSAGGGGGAGSSNRTAIITVTTNGDKYTVVKNSATIADGKKITVEVDGKKVLSEVELSESTFADNMKTVINALDPEKVINTLEADYTSVDVKDWAKAAIETLSAEQQVAAGLAYAESAKMSDVYAALIEAGMTSDDLKAAAADTFTVSYTDGIDALKSI